MAISLAFVAIADLFSKRAVTTALLPDERRTIVPGVLWLVYVQNRHGAMGLFGERTALLVLLALAVVGILAYLLQAGLRRSPLVQIGFGSIAGGALGNVVDRLTHGYVVDFISIGKFFVFNVADAAITFGVVVIVLASWRRTRERA
ncbi:MAG TPA: signal peptidase II [Candidatus Baltobacteraceae bacterium]|nr:signal peptidase II [Candidatus Baltobacteraceae bacterium]